MKCLFIHQNFPGQFVHVARHLAQTGHEVSFITQPRAAEISGVRKFEYQPALRAPDAHPYLRELESGVENGLAVARLCEWLKRDGFTPDIVIGHNGWGEILYIKDVWPHTSLLGYFEFFYRGRGTDVDFDPEFPPEPDAAERLRTRNANQPAWSRRRRLGTDADGVAVEPIPEASSGSNQYRTRGG